jgi:LacI family transcriptional regulator
MVSGDFTPEGGYDCMKTILNLRNRPTAVFVSNDLMAVGALKACSSQYKVPEDISILGFDDMDFSRYLIPSLTTVRKCRNEMGSEGAKMLLCILDKKDLPERYKQIKTQLIKRESCKENK